MNKQITIEAVEPTSKNQYNLCAGCIFYSACDENLMQILIDIGIDCEGSILKVKGKNNV